MYHLNIAKGTTGPRVEFILPKQLLEGILQVQTQILITFHLQNLDLASTKQKTKSQPNLSSAYPFKLEFKILANPNLVSESQPRFNFITSTKHQLQSAEQNPASKSCLNFNFKILTNSCA